VARETPPPPGPAGVLCGAMPADGEPVRRLPFSPADVGDVVDFCMAHGSPFDAPMVRRLLLELTRDAGGVFVLGAGAPPATIVLVAVLIERAVNEAGAAILEIVGARGPIAAPAFVETIVGPAAARAREAGLAAVQIPLRP